MDKLLVRSSPSLQGSVRISGAKNAALPIMAATLLVGGQVCLERLPGLRDVKTMVQLLESMGVKVASDDASGDTVFDATDVSIYVAPYDLVKTMRASILVLGPLLARFGRAAVSLPGGCAIGGRPVQLHLDGLRAMGARIDVENGYIEGSVDGRLKGAHIVFDTITVTGTENLLMAACLADGESVLENCAKEPEVTDLANFLNAMGAKIEGIGTSTLRVQGVEALSGGGKYSVIPDRIEAGTFMVAAAITRGRLTLSPVVSEHLEAVTQKLRDAGAQVDVNGDSITVSMGDRELKSVSLTTHPFPGFPTDMQAQFMVLNCIANGAAVIKETIFENRFMHVQELVRMGAKIKVDGKSAVVTGQERLQGAPVMATDLRASASLVLAGLVADGETVVDRIYHLDRGYEQLERKLQGVGASVERVQ